MKEFVRLIHAEAASDTETCGRVELSYAEREKSRQRATLTSGEDIAIKVPRGLVMRGGDILESEDGRRITVVAAAESVSTVHANTARALTRVAYHLGNRHVWVEVGPSWLRYLHDHVLDEMVIGLGAKITHEQAPFEPEGGAYGGRGHSHAH